MNKHSVKFIRGSKTIWDQLNTTPEKIDNNTLYFIYEDENYSVGKLYLGQRLITDDKIINIKDIGDIQIDDESLIDKQILIYSEESQEWKNSSLEEIIDLSNYYTKNEVDNSLLETISKISTLSFQIVQEKPSVEDIKTNIIYLIPKENSDNENIYDEWIYINNNWELIGTTEINLDNYYNSNYIDNKINDITSQLENISSSQIKNATINNEGVSRIVLIYHGKQWSPSANTSTFPGAFTTGDIVININPNNYGIWLCTLYEEYYQGSTKRYRYTLLPIKIPLSFFQNDSNFLIEHQDISSKEDIINKVISISSSSTNDEYPSAKAVYNKLTKKLYCEKMSSEDPFTIKEEGSSKDLTWQELEDLIFSYPTDLIIHYYDENKDIEILEKCNSYGFKTYNRNTKTWYISSFSLDISWNIGNMSENVIFYT